MLRIKKSKKYWFRLSGGPLNGHDVLLTYGGATLSLRHEGKVGHYTKGVWKWEN